VGNFEQTLWIKNAGTPRCFCLCNSNTPLLLATRNAGPWRDQRLHPRTTFSRFPTVRLSSNLKVAFGSKLRVRCSRPEPALRADSAPTGVAGGRTGVRAIAGVRLPARNSLHRPSCPLSLAL
jgi:hypothetical protein